MRSTKLLNTREFLPSGSSGYDPEAVRPTLPNVPDYGAAPVIPAGETPHVTKKDVNDGDGLIIGSNSRISVDQNKFYNKASVDVLTQQIMHDYKEYTHGELSYYNEWVEYQYATKEELNNLDDAALKNYTTKAITNQVWTTAVTTFATKKELDEMGKKYGVGMVIRGNVPSSGVFKPLDPVYDPEYSADNPKRFQGETYFTQDLKHLWQFIANGMLENVPQIMIDRPEFHISTGNLPEESLFQLWIGREHPIPSELLTIKISYDQNKILIKDVDTNTIVTEITAPASEFSPNAYPKKKFYVETVSPDTETALINFTAWDGAGEIPQILILSVPVMLNGAIRPGDMRRFVVENSTLNGVPQAKGAGSPYIADPEITLEPEIVGIYGKWVDLGPIVGPPNQLDYIVPVTTKKRNIVTAAGSAPDTTTVGFEASAEIQNQYPDQQLFLTIPEGVQGAPGVRGHLGNKAIPKYIDKDWMVEDSYQMLGFDELAWNNLPPSGDTDPDNPNPPSTMPAPVRIEGLSSYEVWKQYHLINTPAVTEQDLTKDNYFLDITGDSAFKFWRDYTDEMNGTADFTQWPGFGVNYDQTDIDAYAQFQRGDAYIPVWDEATGTLAFRFWDDVGDPQQSLDHIALENAQGIAGAGAGLRVRGQVYRPEIDADSVISWTRYDEHVTEPTIIGGNIRGNAWVPTVDATGTLSWANTPAADNAGAVVTPTYIRGEVYAPKVTAELIYDPVETTKIVEVKENLTWEVARRPSDVVPSPPVNIKGITGAGAKLELLLNNDVVANSEFGVTISEPVFETTGPEDLVGTNTQVLTVTTPFDKYNMKLLTTDGTETAWYIGVDSDGRLVTSNTPFTPNATRNSYRKEQDRRISEMRKQIELLQKQLTAKK